MEKFLVGMYIGAVLGICGIGLFPGKNIDDMYVALKECEKSLPRDIHCVVRAEAVLKDKGE